VIYDAADMIRTALLVVTAVLIAQAQQGTVDFTEQCVIIDGQLTNCVPQPGTDWRLDVQGQTIMPRLVYRNMGNYEAIVALHSVDTTAGGGGVRWYEFRMNKEHTPYLHQRRGDYLKSGMTSYSTRIGAFIIEGCQ
jgi:hypothetical protein